MQKSYVALKTKFGGVQTESVVGPVGCLGHPQAYGLHHSCIELSLVFLHSLWKNFNTKLSPISFSMSDISKTKIIQIAIEFFKQILFQVVHEVNFMIYILLILKDPKSIKLKLSRMHKTKEDRFWQKTKGNFSWIIRPPRHVRNFSQFTWL